MTEALLLKSTSPLHRTFALRAGELGIGCWFVSGTLKVCPLSNIIVGISDSDIVAAARVATLKTKSARITISPSLDILAIPDAQGVLVVNLAHGRARGLDAELCTRILQHYHGDLCRSVQDEQAISGFNAQLSQAYEEVNLTYRMSTCLVNSNDARGAVQIMCDELRAVINYGWITVVFGSSNAVLESLQNSVVCSGTIPSSELEIKAVTETIDEAEWKVLTPATHPLAKTAGCEILVQRLHQGEVGIGVLLAGGRRRSDSDISSNEIQLIHAMTGFLELFHQNAFRFTQQRQGFLGTLHALTSAVDAKDPYTRGHSDRVGILASQLAAKLGLDAATVEATRIAGLLHDIGKIGVPEAILTKPARLTDAEFDMIKRHTSIGHQILSQIPSLSFQLPGVLHHHERWDGNGYPHRLSGENIPLIGRLLALADTFDAMSSNRAYRSAMNRSHVLEEIRKSARTQFDPSLTEPFATMEFTQFDHALALSASTAGSQLKLAG